MNYVSFWCKNWTRSWRTKIFGCFFSSIGILLSDGPQVKRLLCVFATTQLREEKPYMGKWEKEACCWSAAELFNPLSLLGCGQFWARQIARGKNHGSSFCFSSFVCGDRALCGWAAAAVAVGVMLFRWIFYSSIFSRRGASSFFYTHFSTPIHSNVYAATALCVYTYIYRRSMCSLFQP